MKKVAIVGGEESKWTRTQKQGAIQRIRKIFCRYGNPYWGQDGILWWDWSPITLLSGHCPRGGVDIWAEEEALACEIKTEIYAPEVRQWFDKRLPDGDKLIGYRSRNILIASACDVLFDIEPGCVVCHGDGRYEAVMHSEPGKEEYKIVRCRRCNGLGYIRSGGTWTLEFASRLGKETQLVVIL